MVQTESIVRDRYRQNGYILETQADFCHSIEQVKTRIKQNLDKATDSGREDKVVMNGIKAKYYN